MRQIPNRQAAYLQIYSVLQLPGAPRAQGPLMRLCMEALPQRKGGRRQARRPPRKSTWPSPWLMAAVACSPSRAARCAPQLLACGPCTAVKVLLPRWAHSMQTARQASLAKAGQAPSVEQHMAFALADGHCGLPSIVSSDIHLGSI